MSLIIYANRASGRGVCIKCKQKIEKDAIQVVGVDSYAKSSARVHLSCLLMEVPDLDITNLGRKERIKLGTWFGQNTAMRGDNIKEGE